MHLAKSNFKVGFIGLGLMGNPMAKNLLKKGFPLTVYNRTRSKTAEFSELGAKIAQSPQELPRLVDVVVTMVSGPKDVKEVLLGPQGVIKGGKPGLISIDMSTIGPLAAKKIAQTLKKAKIEFLDAPVTGSVVKATSGELTIFIGGEEKVYRKAKPVLEAMGTDLQYMGPIGAGQAMKLINNHLVASSLIALAEVVLLADILKLPYLKVSEALENVFAMSPLMKIKLPMMLARKFPVAFSMANMHKDERLTLEEAKKAEKNLPMLKLVERLYRQGLKEGLAGKDNSTILAVLEKQV